VHYCTQQWLVESSVDAGVNPSADTPTISHHLSPLGVGGLQRSWGGLESLCMQTLNIQSVWISQEGQ